MKVRAAAPGHEALARAVTAARSQAVDPDAVARLQARVLAEASAQSMAPASAAQVWKLPSWTMLGGGLVLLAGAALLGLRVGAPAPETVPGAARASSTAATIDAPKPSVAGAAAPIAVEPVVSPELRAVPSEPVPSEPAPQRASLTRRAPALAPAQAALAEPSGPPDRAPDAVAELALLRRALAALPAQPTLALELAEQHAREHVHGVFAQEREAIAIDASLALQRTAAAEARVRRFLAMYPRSPHAPRLRALLGRQDGAAIPTHEQAPTNARLKESL